MKAYKLTSKGMRTYNYTQWVLNEAKTTNGKGTLCGPGWLHFYSHPLLAVFLNRIHCNFDNPRLFEIKAEGKIKNDRGLKLGCTKMTLVKELELPKVTPEQRVKFGILCALEVFKNKEFAKWAQNWLDGTDRTENSRLSMRQELQNCYTNKTSQGWTPANTFLYGLGSLNEQKYSDMELYIGGTAEDMVQSQAAKKKKQIDLIKIAQKAME